MYQKYHPLFAIALWAGVILLLSAGWSLPRPIPQIMSIIGILWLVVLTAFTVMEKPQSALKAVGLLGIAIAFMVAVYAFLVMFVGKPA